MGLITPLVVHQSPIKSSSFGLIMSSWLDTPMRPPDQIRLGALSTALNALISAPTIITRGIKFRSLKLIRSILSTCGSIFGPQWVPEEDGPGAVWQWSLASPQICVERQGASTFLVNIRQWRRSTSSRAEKATLLCCPTARFFSQYNCLSSGKSLDQFTNDPFLAHSSDKKCLTIWYSAKETIH